MTTQEFAIIMWSAVTMLVNVALTMLNFKLYTEFFKQRVQEQRRSGSSEGKVDNG